MNITVSLCQPVCQVGMRVAAVVAHVRGHLCRVVAHGCGIQHFVEIDFSDFLALLSSSNSL